MLCNNILLPLKKWLAKSVPTQIFLYYVCNCKNFQFLNLYFIKNEQNFNTVPHYTLIIKSSRLSSEGKR